MKDKGGYIFTKKKIKKDDTTGRWEVQFDVVAVGKIIKTIPINYRD